MKLNFLLSKNEFFRRWPRNLPMTVLFVVSVLFCISCIVLRAWLCDDAYITFRTIDNFVHGHGLRWNVSERVQGYTHPLWLFVVSIVYFVTREFFCSVLTLQIFLTLATLIIIGIKIAPTLERGVILIAILALSKSFVDYSTSGLENALSHFLLAGFFVIYFRENSRYRLLNLILILSAAILTRLDHLLIYFPALLYEAIQNSKIEHGTKRSFKNVLVYGAIGFAPFIIWESFSLIYYGFLFPNTAYSKIGNGIPKSELVLQGFEYFNDSLSLDPVTLYTIIFALVVIALNRKPREMTIGAGMLFYAVYIVSIGGDFMSGRFFSSLVLCAAVVLVRLLPESKNGYFVAFSVSVMFLSITAMFPSIGQFYQEKHPRIMEKTGIADEYRTYYPYLTLIGNDVIQTVPIHKWIDRGLKYRKEGTSFPINGGVGLTGYYAGSEIHIIDNMGLTEPLCARLPTAKRSKRKGWRVGHYYCVLPDGYVDTLKTDKNQIKDANLAKYYDKLSLIVRGDLLSQERLLEILKMNLGFYDNLLAAYVRSHLNLWLFPQY